ncbi:MAG: acetylornithine deacetylase [Parvularculales bacterium]
MSAPSYSTREMIDRLVSFDTTSRNSNLALIDFAANYLESHGVTSVQVTSDDGNKANLFATLKSDGTHDPKQGGVVLSGHTDVVPVDGQPWTTDPFTVTEKDNRLYGRGVCDMKSFLAVALAAVPRFVTGDLQRPVHLALSYDEEVGCLGAPRLVQWMADEGIRPALVVVGEPSTMRVVTTHKGIRTFRVEITGREAHSSASGDGVNAITIAARLIDFLNNVAREMCEKDAQDDRFTPPHSTINIGSIEGGTAVNIIARRCTFSWEYRPLPVMADPTPEVRLEHFVRDVILPEMRSIAPEADVRIIPDAQVHAFLGKNGSPAETLALMLANQNETIGVSYTTEAGLFQNAAMESVVCGPGDIAQAHKPDEFIELSQIDLCEQFMERVLAYATGP